MDNRNERRRAKKLSASPNWAETLKHFVDLADENRAGMGGTDADLFLLMDAADVVWAVWQDDTQEHGFGSRVVKGMEHLQLGSRGINQTAIHRLDEQHAMALEASYAKRTLGRAH